MKECLLLNYAKNRALPTKKAVFCITSHSPKKQFVHKIIAK